MGIDRDNSHKRSYEDALISTGRVAGFDAPAWDELTENQKQKIREENQRYQREMFNLGSTF